MNVTTATHGNLALAIQDSNAEDDSRLHTVETSIEFNAAYGDFEINIRVYADNEMGWRWLTDGLTAKTRDKAEIVAENMIAWHVTDIAPKEDPVPFLVLVAKPAPVCPSALREPKCTFQQGNRVFEALEYSLECRVFQSQANAVSYCMEVSHEISQEKDVQRVTTHSYINGRFIGSQSFLIMSQWTRLGSWSYIGSAEQAVAGAFDHLQSLVLSGKA
jgi:hypothetical protein